MTDQLQVAETEAQRIFNFGEHAVRTVMVLEQVWFVAQDVCEALEIKNTTDAVKRLDEDEVTRFNLGSLQGVVNIVNESGLYSLILGSRKSEAKQFKKWVTSEVLPSIRRTGSYGKPLSEREQLVATMKLALTHDEELVQVKEKISTVEQEVKQIQNQVQEQITLDSGEQRRIQKAIAIRVYEETSDSARRSQLFRELHREIRDRFGVASYRDLKRKDLQLAIRYIEGWVPKREITA